MKIDDIFEAMTDIDDRFIEAARPLEQYDGFQPVVIKPAPRRAVWKTLVPAAAFVAVVAAAGVVGVNYLRRGEMRTTAASSISSSLKEYWYPDEAKYVVSDDIKYLGFGYQTTYVDGPSMYDASADYAGSYKELAKKSDLIVSGTFIDAIHQTSDSEQILTVGSDHLMMSYNWFEVDSVIKGDIEAGRVLTIGQNSTINSANGNDDKYNVFTCDQLSPMFKGDKWVYFLKLEDDGTFSPVNGPQGRYPLPNSTNRLISSDGDTPNVDEYFTYKNAAPARELIYIEVMKKLAKVEINAPKLEGIFIPETSFTTFTMPEFSMEKFNVSRLGVSANIEIIMESTDIFDMKDGETLENLYLYDLNGDGKRELCATIGGENSAVVQKRVAVYDYANGLYYTLGNELDCSIYGDNIYCLSTDTGTSYTNSEVNNEPVWIPQDNEVLVVKYTVRNSLDHLTVKTKELTLDMLKLVDTSLPLLEVPLSSNNTFTLPDFAGFEFEVDTSLPNPQFSFWWGERSSSSSNNVNNVYLCDLDGDGRHEIIMNCPFVDGGCIRVYGFMDNGEMGEAFYFENGGCRLVELNGELVYKTQDDERAFEFSRSDLKPIFAQSYSCEPLDWDHTINFGEIVPIAGQYNIRRGSHAGDRIQRRDVV